MAAGQKQASRQDRETEGDFILHLSVVVFPLFLSFFVIYLFFFEIMIDTQEVAETVQRGPVHPHGPCLSLRV